jgi:hypothetical protein
MLRPLGQRLGALKRDTSLSRIDVRIEERRLIVSLTPPPGRMAFGFLLLFFTMACLTPLGILGVLQGGPQEQSGGNPLLLSFLDPHANHFGFLWLVGVSLVCLAIPIYAVKLYRASITYVFDRNTGRFTRNGKSIARLQRIEAIRVWQFADSDERPLYMLSIVHSDGFVQEIDQAYEESEIRYAAEQIAEFVRSKVTSNGPPEEEDLHSLRDLWRW